MDSIDYYASKQSYIQLASGVKEVFDKDNKVHVNKLIDDIIRDIERILRFQFEKYFNHYYSILKDVLGEKEAGENWATLLEYGTKNRIIIALQNIGLSRYTAIQVYNNCQSGLMVENGRLKSVIKSLIMKCLRPGSLEYEEVKDIL